MMSDLYVIRWPNGTESRCTEAQLVRMMEAVRLALQILGGEVKETRAAG